MGVTKYPQGIVALRKESVDRNGIASVACITVICVALRKESVDRNKIASARGSGGNLSLSARRA